MARATLQWLRFASIAIVVLVRLADAPVLAARQEAPPTASLPPPTEPLSESDAYIPETGHYVRGLFLSYWRAGGAAARYGYPLSESYSLTGEDGITRLVQLFDRARFELHHTSAGETVLLGLLGAEALAGVTYPRAAPPPPSKDVDYFDATGHILAYGFRDFWYRNDGIRLLGLPLSDEHVAGDRTVQYFERGRLEYDRAAPPERAVTMAPLGVELVTRHGWTLPVRLDLHLNDPAPAQGATVVVSLHAAPGSTVSATFNDRPIPFFAVASGFRAFIGIPPWLHPGSRELVVAVTDANGGTRVLTRAVTVGPTAFPRERIVIPPDQNALLDPAVLEREQARLAPIYALATPRRFWDGAFTLPAPGPITTAYGEMRAYNDGPFASWHGGVDIGAPAGTPVRSAAPGRVVYAGTLDIRGNAVVIDHGYGVLTLYFHQASLTVREGDFVAAGDTIGFVGSTGLSTGPHLHWEVRVGGEPVSPWPWLTGIVSP